MMQLQRGRVPTLRRFGALMAIVALVVPIGLSHAGAPGDLDPEFGDGGRVKGPAGYGTGVASGPDGSLYVTGCLGACLTSSRMILAKYSSTGSLDTSFAENGRIVVDNAHGRAILFQGAPHNKIWVAGDSANRFTLFRYNQDGSPDGTFDEDGRRVGPFGSATALAQDAQGKIVVTGTDITINDGDFLLWRLNADGTPDGGFGTAGSSTANIAGTDNATSVALIGSKIFVGGFIGNPLIFDSHLSAIAAFDLAGALDLTFGVGGKLTGFVRRVDSLAEQNGKLVAGGSIVRDNTNPQEDKAWLGRFELNGAPDAGFGTGGSSVGSKGDNRALLKLTGNRIVAAVGRTAADEFAQAHNHEQQFRIAGFTSEGIPDPNFGEAGTVASDFGEAIDEASALTTQAATEKLIAAGRSGEFGGAQLALARYEKDPTSTAANVGLEATGAPESTVEGTSIRYLFKVTNSGPDSAFRTVLTNTIDPKVRFEGARSEIGPCQRADREIRCVLEGIAPGKSAEAFVQVQTTSPGEVTHRATVSSSSTDSELANNAALIRTRVVPADGKWSLGPDMSTARHSHGAILLNGPACEGQAAVRCGNVFVVSGDSSEIYDPVTGSWRPGPAPPVPLKPQFTSTGLADGRVLVAGGIEFPSFEEGAHIFDPRTGGWTTAPPMNTPRGGHAAVLLPNGKVLVTGGVGPDQTTPCPGNPDQVMRELSSAEIFDPIANRWVPAQAMQHRRAPAKGRHSLTVLPDGKVLAIGGYRGGAFEQDDPADPCDDGGDLAPAELFDPVSGSWTGTGPMGVNRVAHSATLLPNSKVLAVSGYSTSFTAGLATATTELFAGDEVAQNGVRGAWKPTTPVKIPGARHTADFLSGRGVLVTGGMGQRTYGSSPDEDPAAFNRSEIYEPVSATWTSAGLLNVARADHTSTIFPPGPAAFCGARCGRVLVAGGNTSTNEAIEVAVKSTEIYTAKPRVTGIFPSSGPLLGGTEITITGTALAGTTRVVFEGEPPLVCGAKGVAKCWIDEDLPDLKVHAISPPHAIPEKVHVLVETDPGFVSTKTEADYFRYEGLIKLPGEPEPPPVGQNDTSSGQTLPPKIASGGPGQAPSLSASRGLAAPGSPLTEVFAPGSVLSQAPQAAQGAQLAQQAALGSQLGPQLQRQAQASPGAALGPGENRQPAPHYVFSKLEQAGLAASGLLLLAALAVCTVRAYRVEDPCALPACAAGNASVVGRLHQAIC